MKTSTIPSHATQSDTDMFRTISLTALLAGTLDISSAIVKYYIDKGAGPVPLFKYIASGVFGQEALSGGTLMIVWGLVFHYMIAFIFTVFLFLIYPTIHKFIKNKFITGIVYGLFIWVVMNRMVVPLSLVNQAPFNLKQAAIAAAILICMIGLPVALIANKFYQNKKKSDISI